MSSSFNQCERLPDGNCRNVHFGFSERGTAITNKYDMSAVNVMLSIGRMLDWYDFMYELKDQLS